MFSNILYLIFNRLRSEVKLHRSIKSNVTMRTLSKKERRQKSGKDVDGDEVDSECDADSAFISNSNSKTTLG